MREERKRLLTENGSGHGKHSKSCRGCEKGVRRAYPGKRSQLPVPQCMCGRKAMGSSRSGFLELAYMRRAHFVASFNSHAISAMTHLQEGSGQSETLDTGCGTHTYLIRRVLCCHTSPLPFVWKRDKSTMIFQNCQSFGDKVLKEPNKKYPGGYFFLVLRERMVFRPMEDTRETSILNRSSRANARDARARPGLRLRGI